MKKYLISIIFMLSTSTTQIMANPWRTAELDGICNIIEARIAARIAAIKSDPQNQQRINIFAYTYANTPMKYIECYRGEKQSLEMDLSTLTTEKKNADEFGTLSEHKSNLFSGKQLNKISLIFKEISTLLDIAINNYTAALNKTENLPMSQGAQFVELALKSELLFDAFKNGKPLTPQQLERIIFIDKTTDELCKELINPLDERKVSDNEFTTYLNRKRDLTLRIRSYFQLCIAEFDPKVAKDFEALINEIFALLEENKQAKTLGYTIDVTCKVFNAVKLLAQANLCAQEKDNQKE
jgi:hypothetical protein